MLATKRWTAAVDYVRMTYEGADAEGVAERYYAPALSYLAKNRPGPQLPATGWAWQGYTGAASLQAAWGTRPGGAILQVSGQEAARAAVLDVPYTGVPRLDLAVTVWGCEPPSAIPRTAADASSRARAGQPGRPWSVRLIDGYGAGDTAYIGSRNSAWFIRIYDKEAESESDRYYAGAIRYEVEAHDGEAAALLAAVRASGGRPDIVAGFVAGYLGRRGVALPPWVQGTPVDIGSAPREATPLDAKIRWLRQGVAPTVALLLGAGLTREELRCILGLSDEPAEAAGKSEVAHYARRRM